MISKNKVPIDLNGLVNSLKDHPRYFHMGMIAGHLGVVRGTSLDGRRVTAVQVHFDTGLIQNIKCKIENLPGIIKVLIELREGRLTVGEDIMAVVVGGDTRQHVFPALAEAVDLIKQEAVKKEEFFEL